MIKDNRIVAIIPARGGSKTIPKKNIVDFCGKPLIVWSIEEALRSSYISSVYVSSDDEAILAIAKKSAAEIIHRPKNIARDRSSTEDVLRHAIGHIEKGLKGKLDTLVLLQATSPLRTKGDIDKAVKAFISQKADSLFSAALLEDFCCWEIKGGRYSSVTFDYKNRGRRQDRKPYYLENGSIYIFKREILMRYKNRLGGKMTTYVMPLWKSYEIDKPEDLKICEYFMKNRILRENTGGLIKKIEDIQLIIYDFDGVLTNNKAIIREDGLESVMVNRSDGLAISALKGLGIPQLILTTETNVAVRTRAEKLKIPIIRGVKNKKEIFLNYCKTNDIAPHKVLYIGNDINDLEVMKIVGYPACPLDASSEIRSVSRIILGKKGGDGVVRELLYHINMKHKNG